ncbi:MAG: hypothetical protein ACRDBM_05915 [Sporomusa sp.]
MKQTLPAPSCIAAIIPSYKTLGDGTVLITTDGSTTAYNTHIRTIIRRLARQQAIDLAALRARTKIVTDRINLAPLPLTQKLVLVPVKVRQPRVAGDTTIGYVNYYAVKAVTANKNKPCQATILLSGKNKIPVLWTAATVNHQLVLARLTTSPELSFDRPTTRAFHESGSSYDLALLPLAIKLVDVFSEILHMKQGHSSE